MTDYGGPMAEFVPESVTDVLVVTTPEGVQLSYQLAGLGSRYLARFVDSIFRIVLVVIVARAVRDVKRSGLMQAAFAIGLFAIILLYDVISELATRGRTIGKAAVGIPLSMI